MADLRSKARQKDIGIASEGAWKDARFTRKGDLVVVNYGIAAGFEGTLYGANFGSVTTPIATPATTAITAARPQMWIRIPSNRAVLPVYCAITVESCGATTQGEIAIARTSNDVGNGTSSAATTSLPISVNPRVSKGSSVTPRQLATGDVTAETDYLELDRYSFAASAVNQKFEWKPNDWLPPLAGAASFLAYIGGNAVNFFGTIIWIEDDVSLAN